MIRRNGVTVRASGADLQASAVVAQAAKGTNGNGRRALAAQQLRTLSSPGVARHLSSPLVDLVTGRSRFANDVGLTYGGLRDVDGQLGYLPTLTIRDYRRRYKRGGIAKRIVNAYPLATWSADARITEDPNTNTRTEFEAAAADLFDQLKIWSMLTRADILAGLGHYSALVIGDGAANLESPLPARVKKVMYLQAYAEDNAFIEKWDLDLTSPRFGLPLIYKVNLGAIDVTDGPFYGGNRPATKQVNVHHSRVIHIAEGLLENDVYGEPCLESVWNLLDDLVKVVGGGAEAAWKRMDPGMQLDLDAEMEIDQPEIEAMEDQVSEYQHGLRRVLQTRGTKANLLSTTVAGFGSNAASIIQLICGTKGIPQRILLGSERGEQASTQDRENWQERKDERRRMHNTPVVRQLVDRFIEHGVLPTPKVASGKKGGAAGRNRAVVRTGTNLNTHEVPTGRYRYVVSWPKVGALDRKETAEVISKLAGANQANSQANGGLILTADEIRHRVLDMGARPAEADVTYGKPVTDTKTATEPTPASTNAE